MTNDHSDSLTITVLDTATIYEGAEAIFRYDLPGSGVKEGWALAGVLDQAQKSAGPAWPAVDVQVLTDVTSTEVSEEAVSIIQRHLRMAGVTIAATPDPLGAPATAASTPPSSRERAPEAQPDPEQDPEPPALVRSVPATAGSKRRLLGIGAAVAVLACVLAGGGALWHMSHPQKTHLATPLAEGDGALAEATATLSPGAVPTATPPKAPELEHISVLGMELDLPPGFTWTEDGGVVTAVGPDPDLRIIFDSDPAYGVPAQQILAELREQVLDDPVLFDPVIKEERVSYIERPGDDSTVAWTSWVENDMILSVGCHSKYERTLAQRAACRMAVRSLHQAKPLPALSGN